VLEQLADRTQIVAVVTQPDRPAGRGHKLAPTPVKTAALARGLRVDTPTALKPYADELRALAPDVLVVASYGRIVPQAILDVPLSGIALNVHPSLLPLYRGATPLQSALRDGRDETGVTIIAMDAGMDTGDIVLQERTPLGPEETYGELHDRLALRGAALLIDAVEKLEAGTLTRTLQSERGAATLTRPLAKEDMALDFSWPAARIVDTVRSLSPSPGARALLEGEQIKVLAARRARADEHEYTADDGVVVRAGDGAGVVLLSVVPPNRGRMSGAAFRRARLAV
jgi:methionyl-tRNA formyltransferase